MKPDVVIREEGMVKFKTKPGYTWRQYWGWQLNVNQGWRPATLLANYGSNFLFRYYMPNGKYYLHEVWIKNNGDFSSLGNSVNKKRVPERWKLAEHFWPLKFWTEE